MRRLSYVLFATVGVTLLMGQPLQAGWYQQCRQEWKQFCENFKRDFHRNNCWPEPFVEADRVHVQAPLAMMTAQGWQHENLLGSHHFAPDSAKLTTAGELKVREILTQSPPSFRTIFVQRGATPEATAARVASVEQWVAGHLPDTTVADVRETHLVPEGRPADVVDAINVRFKETQPPPQLPKRKSIEIF